MQSQLIYKSAKLLSTSFTKYLNLFLIVVPILLVQFIFYAEKASRIMQFLRNHGKRLSPFSLNYR